MEKADARGMYITGVYGMSEVQALFCRWANGSPVEYRKRGGGIPIGEGAACRVRDQETGDLLGPGEPGELELKGPSLLMEYFRNPEATAKAMTDDGFIRTGDLAQLTDDGGFHYLSRLGDVLRLGGFLVAPAEIEARVMDHASVRDVQVVGATIEGRNRAVAFVLPEEDAFDEAAVLDHCATGLAKYKVPARVIALDAFPVYPVRQRHQDPEEETPRNGGSALVGLHSGAGVEILAAFPVADKVLQVFVAAVRQHYLQSYEFVTG